MKPYWGILLTVLLITGCSTRSARNYERSDTSFDKQAKDYKACEQWAWEKAPQASVTKDVGTKTTCRRYLGGEIICYDSAIYETTDTNESRRDRLIDYCMLKLYGYSLKQK